MKNEILIIVVILFVITSTVYSQSNMNLNGTNSINVSFGFKMNSTTSASTTLSEVNTETNILIDLNYQYWFDNQWSVDASVGTFGASANVNYSNISTVTIIPLLFGFSYYPEKLAIGDVGRIHFGLNTGIYIGSGTQTKTSLDNLFSIGSDVVNETVFGVEPNLGIDFFISSWLKIGPKISYHFISNFKELGNKGYSGGVFAINLGILL
ncbi:MAG: outer membrane beta-barrel protein [Ignavibacteriae bacterium]|nr:outer membrane beta-barrel protein [Ignavibacteriota bacterium]